MADVRTSLHRRIDCAETIIAFEIAPGAAVGVDPDEVASAAYKFLRAADDNASTREALRFRSLRLLASIENARAAQKSNAVTFAQKRALLVALVNAERIRALRAAGTWNDVVARGAPWSLESTDTFDWGNSQWLGDWAWPAASFAVGLEQASHERTEAFRQQLLGIKATNRDDRWEDLLGSKA